MGLNFVIQRLSIKTRTMEEKNSKQDVKKKTKGEYKKKKR